jgi:hypothetical protein
MVCTLCEATIDRVREKSAFCKNGSYAGPPKDIESTLLHAPIFGVRGAEEIALDLSGESVARRAVVEGFEAARSDPLGGIEMHAHEDGVAIAIRDGDARAERDEHVSGARHHGPVTGGLQPPFQPFRNIESVSLFRQPLSWYSATVMPSMTGIDDDGPR